MKKHLIILLIFISFLPQSVNADTGSSDVKMKYSQDSAATSETYVSLAITLGQIMASLGMGMKLVGVLKKINQKAETMDAAYGWAAGFILMIIFFNFLNSITGYGYSL